MDKRAKSCIILGFMVPISDREDKGSTHLIHPAVCGGSQSYGVGGNSEAEF